MSNWDLMMPGMGLTGIGLAGLILSYAGIAHTFIDGMHALTGLTMFVGLIFLAAGILDGGISTSKRAKITTLVIVAISLGFGFYALATMNTSDFTLTVVLILLAVALPAIVIGYLAMKRPSSIKPIGLVLGLAVASAMVIWVTAGSMNSEDAEILEEMIDEEVAEGVGPIFAIEILKDSAQEGNPDYSPDTATVTQGHTIEWTNEDAAPHTVTSSIDYGETFDSSLISAGEKFTLDTTNLEIGEHEYLCIVHPWMIATLVIEAPKEATKIIIPEGAAIPEDGKIFYDPETINISTGTTVEWINEDPAMHTATSGIPASGSDGVFDSGILNLGDTYQFTFTDVGSYDYYCILHPWMIGTVNVE